MTLKKRQFTRDFKLHILREIAAGKSLAQAAREHQLHPTLINKWKQQHAQYPEHAFSGHGHIYKDEARTAELERMIGQLTMENALLKKPWRGSNCKSAQPGAMEADHDLGSSSRKWHPTICFP